MWCRCWAGMGGGWCRCWGWCSWVDGVEVGAEVGGVGLGAGYGWVGVGVGAGVEWDPVGMNGW